MYLSSSLCTDGEIAFSHRHISNWHLRLIESVREKVTQIGNNRESANRECKGEGNSSCIRWNSWHTIALQCNVDVTQLMTFLIYRYLWSCWNHSTHFHTISAEGCVRLVHPDKSQINRFRGWRVWPLSVFIVLIKCLTHKPLKSMTVP